MRTTNTITSFDQLSLTLNATQVAAVLGISRSNAYELMRSEGFPTLHIGKRMLVPKDRLIRWIEANASRGNAHERKSKTASSSAAEAISGG